MWDIEKSAHRATGGVLIAHASVVKNGHHKDKCCDKIGQCVQYTRVILNVNTIVRAHAMLKKEEKDIHYASYITFASQLHFDVWNGHMSDSQLLTGWENLQSYLSNCRKCLWSWKLEVSIIGPRTLGINDMSNYTRYPLPKLAIKKSQVT